MSLREFRDRCHEALLDFLWRYWTRLGVSGQIGEGDDRYVVDPESLLVFSASFCRYDSRLYDLVTDWLRRNGRWVSIQRLKALAGGFGGVDHPSLGCLAAQVSREGERRWRKLASDWLPEDPGRTVMFQSPDGEPMDHFPRPDPVALKYGYLRSPYRPSEKAGVFSSERTATLLLQMRGLFGLSARAETVLVLLNHAFCKVQDIVDGSGYSWKSIQEALRELEASGVVVVRDGRSRGRFFSLREPSDVLRLFRRSSAPFPNWFRLLDFFQRTWQVVSDRRMEGLSEKTWQAEIAKVLSERSLDGLLFGGFHRFRDLRKESIPELPEWIAEL